MHLLRIPRVLAVAAICIATTALALTVAAGPGASTARAANSFNPQCSDPSAPATRTPANPLMLATPPTGGDPLRGASFFVAGPARGSAAGAIAQMLGIGVGQTLGSGQALGGLPDSLSWSQFLSQAVTPKLASEPAAVQTDIGLLEKIAQEPAPLRISAYSGGGSPVALYTQTRKLFCTVLQADPGTIPILSTYFLHAELGGCSSTAEIEADSARFKAQISAVAKAIARRPAVMFLEADAVGSSSCMAKRGSIGAWENLMRYEATTFEALPHTAVYLEGGYSDANSAAYAAKVLNAAGIRQIQGFFTNDTHLQWTSHELAYAKAISARTGGAHFVINTAANGRGPLLNPHPRTQGIEDLCNPPGRGLGIPDTTTPGLNSHLDGLLWIAPPGNSSGSCNGGTASGTFWVAGAESLAANANEQLGPGYPSRPY